MQICRHVPRTIKHAHEQITGHKYGQLQDEKVIPGAIKWRKTQCVEIRILFCFVFLNINGQPEYNVTQAMVVTLYSLIL